MTATRTENGLPAPENRSYVRRLAEVGLASAKLGLTSFGGPIAHIGYFHHEYVRRRKWLDERGYADLVALCQFLPGPASSQVGIGVGLIRAGLLGGAIAWLGFTLPSAVALALFAIVWQSFDIAGAGPIHGLHLAAVAIVAQAVLGMGQKLAQGRSRATIAVCAAAVALLWPSALGQVAAIAGAALIGWLLYAKEQPADDAPALQVPVGRKTAVVCLALFAALLVALPLARLAAPGVWLSMIDSFYRSGSLVFGGGHVVLPLLEREFVPAGSIARESFLAGYGAAQAVPGPLFTFAAYIGAAMKGAAGAVVATIAIFLPAFLLVVGCLPYWNSLRRYPAAQAAMAGANAAVVGILLAALYSPLSVAAVGKPADFALAAVLYAALAFWKLPPWLVVLAGALGGSLVAAL
ncbi:chromate efflux transporter [Paenibacillus sp. GYB003]|uniref:chromate efflux transporter n=1 Tax=Paenibacillus sp. GYB003 TaxID=2994392 RepID=UPI002F96108C